MVAEDKEIKVSAVIPVWNEEEENIGEIYSRLSQVLAARTAAYEILFVDDGSADRTFQFLKGLTEDRHVRIVRLSKNFGQVPAMLAGMRHARGATVVTMDVDLQCVPEDIPFMLDLIDQGHDMVSGWRKDRKGSSAARKFASFVISKFIQKKTGINFHDWGCSFNAARAGLVHRLKDFGASARYAKPLLARMAVNPVEREVRHYARKRGKSKYSLSRLGRTAWDLFANFSLSPTGEDQPLFVVQEILQAERG